MRWECLQKYHEIHSECEGSGNYLFYCNKRWGVSHCRIADSWHNTEHFHFDFGSLLRTQKQKRDFHGRSDRAFYICLWVHINQPKPQCSCSHAIHWIILVYLYLHSVILWRMHLISKIKRTKTIVGTTTYRAQYLGAFGMACRICSFLVVSGMNLARWLYIGVPFLSILVLLYFHFHYDVKEPDSKKLYEVESGFF